MNGPPSNRYAAEGPKAKSVIARYVVKVVRDDGGAVALHNEDKSVIMQAPAAARRLRAGERSAYFRAEVDEDGILEVCDRVPAPVPAW